MAKTMKAAIYYNNTDIRIEERPIPEIGPGELLVKTVASGLCGGEAMEWYHIKRAPKVMGHEPSGIVVQVGEGVSKFKEGDRVFVNHHVSSFNSHEALRGNFTRDLEYRKSKLDPGTMCEFFRAPAANVDRDTHIIPENVSFEAATLMEPWGCVVGGLKVSHIQPGDTVAVIGCGFMGQGFVHMASLFGAGKVFASDFSDYRLEKAKELGANFCMNPKEQNPVEFLRDNNNGHLADVVITTVPNVKALESAYELMGVGATMHINAPPPGDQIWNLKPEHMYMNELTITTKYSADQNDVYQMLRWLESGKLNTEAAITHRFELEGINEAFDLLVRADKSLKSVIYPNGFEIAGL